MWGGERSYICNILAQGIRWSWVVTFITRRFNPKENVPGTHWIRGWLGHTAGLDAVEKGKIYFPCCESNSGRQKSVTTPAELSQHLLFICYPGKHFTIDKNRNSIYSSVILYRNTWGTGALFLDYSLNLYFPLVDGWSHVVLWYERPHIFNSLLQ